MKDILTLREELIVILKNLVNDTIYSGIYPPELKISKITPIFKSGSRDCMSNYRPISVISVFSKVVEKILKKRMLSFISRYIAVDDFQYGFMKNSSTLCATVDFVSYISRALDDRKLVIAIFVDLSKAFDVVGIEILLDKLNKMGFRGPMYSLIKTYLFERKQYVKVGDVCSQFEASTCGVPQGSVLGPLLYSLYVLNLRCAGLRARYFTFADDTVLVYEGMDKLTLSQEVSQDITRYVNWLYSNKLKINIHKTNYMIFKQKNKHIDNLVVRMNNVKLNRVSSVKYLGLVVDDRLDWSEHVNKISDKIIPMIAATYRCRDYLTMKTKMNVYNAFFLSHLRYLLPIWGMCGKTNFSKIQTLQNKTLKVLFNYDRLFSTETLYKELSICKINVIMQLEQAKMMYKIINKKQKSNTNIVFYNDIHTYGTRGQNNVYQIQTRTNVGLNNPVVQASKVFNKLPDDIKSVRKYNLFVKNLKVYLGIS